MTEQFNQKVTVTVDIDTSKLDKIGEVTRKIDSLDDKFSDTTGKNIRDTSDALANFNDSLGTIQTDFDGFEDDLLESDDPLANFTGAVQRTQKEVGNLNEATKDGFKVEGRVDTDTFVDDLRKSIEEDIIENDDLPAVSPRIGEEAEFENRSALSADIKQKVKTLEETLRAAGSLDVHLRIDDDSKIKKDAILGQMAEKGFLEIPMRLGKGFEDDTLDNFETKITNIADKLEDTTDSLNQATQAARETGDAFENSVDKTKGETQSFRELADDADNLSQLKDAVTKSNKDLAAASKDSEKAILLEKIQAGELADDLDILTKAEKKNLDKKERQELLATRLASAFNGVSKSSNKLAKSSRKVRSRLDDTRDSLRASSKVGELFEDGLGSLSLNLGAFTLALRNFLTQVPLLLAALGALGAAATAVVGSFIAAAAAIGTVVAAGAVAKANSLKEEFADIEKTGEALQKVFQEVRRLLFQAVQPLIELDEATSLFERTMVGLAKVVNIFAQTFAEQIGVVEELFDMLGDAIMSSMSRLVAVFAVMIDELGKDIAAMTASAINGFANLLLFSTEFFNSIEDGMGSIRNLIDATKEISFVGKAAFGGLAPIIDAFSAFVEGTAKIINNLDDSFVSAGVTATVLLIAFDKIAGVLGTLISLFPALSVSLQRADGSLIALTRAFGSFLKQHPVIFSGFTSLSEVVENLGDEHALVTSKLLTTQGALDGLDDEFKGHIKDGVMAANSMDEFEDELTSVAIQLGVTEKEAEEINDELQKIAINSRLAEKSMDELGDLDANTVLRRRQQVGIKQDRTPTRTPFVLGSIPGVDKAKKSIGTLGSQVKGLAKPLTRSFGFVKGLLGSFKDLLMTIGQVVKGPLTSAIARVPLLGGPVLKLAGAVAGVTVGITALLAKLAPLVALLLLFGGVAVGIMGNIDKIKASLAEFGEVGGRILRDLGSYLFDTFIRVWNALTPAIEGVMMAVRPLMDMLSGLSSGDSDGTLSVLITSAKILVDLFILLVELVSRSIKFFGAIIGPILGFVGAMALAVDDAIAPVAAKLKDLSELIKGIFNEDGSGGGLTAALTDLENITDSIFVGLNKAVNEFIKVINKIPGIDIEQRVSIGTKDDGRFDVTKDDVIDGGRKGLPDVEGKTPAQFNYEEYNNTTNNTNVDAQPEDTATISRVVEDAIREANSFGRRTAGGQ